jgi:predicted PurR-regulated permease PerM
VCSGWVIGSVAQGSARGRRIGPRMIASRIEARAVFKIVAIVLIAVGVALLLQHVVVEVRTTIRWLLAAVFLALALSPLVELVQRPRIRGRSLPRWAAILVAYVIFGVAFTFLVLEVIPPIVREVEQLGPKLPTYVKDFENWANDNSSFQELNEKYNITGLLSKEAANLPSTLGDAASAAKEVTVGLLNNLVEAIVVLTLAFFLLLDGGRQFELITGRLPRSERDKLRRIGPKIARIVRSYVSVNVLLAVLAGVFTWLALELLGVDLAVPLAVLVAFFDLVPLVGFTIGGVLVAVVACFDNFPTTVLIWLALFVIYQQLQDRVIQPVFYRNAVRMHPVAAIVVVLAGAQLAGILGALLAIPIAASLAVAFDEFFPASSPDEGDQVVAAGPAVAGDAPAG